MVVLSALPFHLNIGTSDEGINGGFDLDFLLGNLGPGPFKSVVPKRFIDQCEPTPSKVRSSAQVSVHTLALEGYPPDLE